VRSYVLSFLSLLVAMPALALDKPEDIRACARKNFPVTSSTQTFQLKTIGRDGSARTLHATAFWKRATDGKAKVMLQVDQPDDLRGSSYLMLEKSTRDDLFMFLPGVPRVKRIHGNQTSDKLWGSDFSYEDIKQVQGIFDGGTLTRQADTEIAGRKTYVLDFVPAKVEESAYTRVLSHIDQQTCAVLRTDFFKADGKARKRLTVNPQEVRQDGTRWVAHFYEMSDLLDETRTELRIDKMTADKDLPDRLFNPQTFYLGR
jgi:hypothetical protein